MPVTDVRDEIVMGPAERYEVVISFSELPASAEVKNAMGTSANSAVIPAACLQLSSTVKAGTVQEQADEATAYCSEAAAKNAESINSS